MTPLKFVENFYRGAEAAVDENESKMSQRDGGSRATLDSTGRLKAAKKQKSVHAYEMSNTYTRASFYQTKSSCKDDRREWQLTGGEPPAG